MQINVSNNQDVNIRNQQGSYGSNIGQNKLVSHRLGRFRVLFLGFLVLAIAFSTASISVAQGTKLEQQSERSNIFDQGVELINQEKFNEAFVIFLPVAEAGNANAQYNLGIMYDNGQGVEQSDAKDVKWYQKAAAQGDVEAVEQLRKLGVDFNSSN